MKMHTLSTLKLFLLFEICFNLCYAQKKENYTEKDWVNYAKAQGNSYWFTLKSLKNIMNDKEYEDYLDSMARVDIFKPLVYNGIEIRKSDIKPPVLTGTVSYYFLDGKLASQAEFVSGVANGKCLYYYPNGNIYKIEVYKNGELNAKDTLKTFSTKGQLIASEIETDSTYAKRVYYIDNGQLMMEVIDFKSATLEDTASEKYFDLETKNEQTRVYIHEKNEANFYNHNGKKISEMEFIVLAIKEEKNPPVEPSVFPKRKSLTDVSNEMLLSSYYKKIKSERKKINTKWETGESFKQCGKNQDLGKFNTNYYNLSNNSNYTHSAFLDSLYCEPGKQIMRTAQTKNGMLHGDLKYYYPTGQLLAMLNFYEDYPDGNFIRYYDNGNIKMKSRCKMGFETDSTFEFTNSNVLKTLTLWEDSIKYKKKTFWEDGKIIQQMELCTGEKVTVLKENGGRNVRSKKIIENRYYNKQGEEISKKQFTKDYPYLLPELDTRKFRIKL